MADDAELVATLQEKENNFDDPMDVSKFATEIVEYLDLRDGGLEGDAELIHERIVEGIQRQIQDALSTGQIHEGADFKIDFAVRDPHDGTGTLLFQTDGKVTDGAITIDNHTPTVFVNDNLDITHTSFSPECMEIANKTAKILSESLGLKEGERNGFEEGHTYRISAFEPAEPTPTSGLGM
jgi:hypothetical protein